MLLNTPKKLVTGLITILSLAASPLWAEQVTLSSIDGKVTMSGDLLEFDGITYRLQMLIGEISVDAAGVECKGPGCPSLAGDQAEFSIAGGGSMSEGLFPALIEVFALNRGGDLEVESTAGGSHIYNVLNEDGTVFASIHLQSSDTIGGLTSLLEGSAVIGVSTRQMSKAERSAFGLAGKGPLDGPDEERILALDAAIAVVNPENPVQILSLSQISGIMDGSIANWSQVGGNDAPIRIYRQAETSDTSQTFVAAADGLTFTNSASVLESDQSVSDAVVADVTGIGLTSFAQMRNARALVLRSVCGELFEPTEFSIKTEEYPLTERLYLYTVKGDVPDVAAEFLAFVASPDAQDIIRSAGFVSQNMSRANLDAQGRRLAQAILSSSGRSELLQLQDLTSVMLDADRLSFTLHYGSDGQLDARAQADITRLAALIRAGAFSSRQMLVLGFSDNTGVANAQLTASQNMAKNVRDAIVAATGRVNIGNLRISPVGYGQLMPLRCNETLDGRRSNNRVEIWVK